MRGLIAYVAILCLSFSTGVSSEEKSETHSKEFRFIYREVLFSMVPFWKNEMVFAVNDDYENDEKWKIYLETNNLNESKVKSCDIELKSSYYYALFNVGNSKAVLVERADKRMIMLNSADLKSCKIHKAKIDVTNPNVLRIVIVPHENNYDVIFENNKICKDFLCKATFDYEGKSVKAPSGFLRNDNVVVEQVEHNGNTYIAILSYEHTIKVVLLQDKDKQPNELFSGKRDVIVGVSAKEQLFGYCLSKDQKKIECKQFNKDGVDESKGINFEVTLDKEGVQSIDTYNLKKGLLVLWTNDPSETSNHRTVSIAHLNEMGKEVKSMDINLKCYSDKDILLPKIVQNSNGEYCITSMCIDSNTYNEFFRNTRCFLNSELF